MDQQVLCSQAGGETRLDQVTVPPVPTVYRNPTPVVVLLVPMMEEEKVIGLLGVRRKLRDGFGKLALPGGYQNEGEPWSGAGLRELEEEAGIPPSAVESVEIFGVEDSTGCKQVLLFGITAPVDRAWMESFVPNDEVSSVELITEPQELAFPTHTEMVRRFFSLRRVE